MPESLGIIKKCKRQEFAFKLYMYLMQPANEQNFTVKVFRFTSVI